MKKLLIILLISISSTLGKESDSTQVQQQDYTIDQPGTITFTVVVKIKGKVDKPQVIIFLPKEKPLYQKHVLDHSFSDELSEQLPFVPIFE
ncbi:MAG: hypothetical protein Q4F84_04335 [Fibrobacter sp.]|nr:hypothetical protein [Fibrobacter sp.]